MNLYITTLASIKNFFLKVKGWLSDIWLPFYSEFKNTIHCVWSGLVFKMLHQLYTVIILIQKFVDSTCHSWSWVPDVYIMLYVYLTTMYPRKPKFILIYCVKYQQRAECRLIFFSFQLCIPVRMDHRHKNNLDRFCYICGNMVLPNCQAKKKSLTLWRHIIDYFGVKLGDQDKSFALHICSKMWRTSGIGWRVKDHITDSYFCMINLKGINRKNNHHVQYANVPSAKIPIPHSPDLPVPEPDANMKNRSNSEQWQDCCS